MALPGKSTLGLAAKLSLCLSAGMVVFSVFFGYLTLHLEQRHFEQLVVASADRISDIIQRSTRYSMLRNDRDALYHLIRDIGQEQGVHRVRIYNEQGGISFSTLASEVGTMVDKKGEACFACHAQEAPLTRLARPDRERIFILPSGERILGLIRPIENHPDCYNAACHAHPKERRILGVIDNHLSLATVDAQLSSHRKQIILVTILAVVTLYLLTALFVWRLVYNPVRELTTGTERVARGDLEHRIPVRSGDELGRLACSFNKMTADLKAAHDALTRDAQTLEERVRQKTSELERTYSSLVRSEKMASLGKLAATVAHEVNNPLFGMLTYARLGLKALANCRQEDPCKAELSESLRVIERESKRCGDIMRNLLIFARQGTSADTSLRREPTAVHTVVERALRLVQHQLELQQVELETRLEESIPLLNCDPGKLQQALLVLLFNAAEAMPEGGRLTVESTVQGGEQCVIRVRDTGCGIPADALNQIFEPFFTTKEDQHRTGLGLAIARSIVDAHGGSIEVQSQEGKGTEFTVRIPLQGAPQANGGENA